MLIDFQEEKREVILTMKSSKVSSVFNSWLCYKILTSSEMEQTCFCTPIITHIHWESKMNSSSNCSYAGPPGRGLEQTRHRH